MSAITGIVQPDILVRPAVIEALRELRVKPWLLDHAFAGLARDPLTRDVYGAVAADRAKRWLLATRISVVMSKRLGEVRLPCVVVSLLSSVESQDTLGTQAPSGPELAGAPAKPWTDLTTKFVPVAYNRSTGALTLPPDLLDQLDPCRGQVLVAPSGARYPVLDLGRDRRSTSWDAADPLRGTADVVVQKGITEELAGSVFRGLDPPGSVEVGAAGFDEQYQLECLVNTEEEHLLFLHSALVFQLLRRRLDLLVERGLAKPTISSSDIRSAPYTGGDSPEVWWSRIVSLSGTVYHSWPIAERDRAQDLGLGEPRADEVDRRGGRRRPGGEPVVVVEGGLGLDFGRPALL